VIRIHGHASVDHATPPYFLLVRAKVTRYTPSSFACPYMGTSAEVVPQSRKGKGRRQRMTARYSVAGRLGHRSNDPVGIRPAVVGRQALKQSAAARSSLFRLSMRSAGL